MHETRIAEQCNRQLSIITAVYPSCQDLMDHIIDYAMQEIVPRKLEKEILENYERATFNRYPKCGDLQGELTTRSFPRTVALAFHQALVAREYCPSGTIS